MSLIELNIEEILKKLESLLSSQKPLWGEMTPQRMVEHLSDSLKMSTGKISFPMEISEEMIPKMQSFLNTDKAMARNIPVSFAPKNATLRHDEIELAIDEFLLEWIDFEDFFSENPNQKTMHPYYGFLDHQQWYKLHQKHFTHHFQQFGL
jgi:hypothetical protein